MTAPNQQPPTTDSYQQTFLQGVILGLVVGCALVLWFSPQSGRELLEIVKKRLPSTTKQSRNR